MSNVSNKMAAPGVGVAALLIEKGRVLLVRRRNAPAQGLWAFPGGRVELGEPLHDAVRRELMEECSLAVRVGRLVDVLEAVESRDGGLSHWVLTIYMVERTSGEPVAGDDAAEVRWVSKAELDLLPTAQGVVELAAQALG